MTNGNMDGFSFIRWVFIAIFFIITMVSAFWTSSLVPIMIVVSIFIVAILHGIERYGIKNILVFFALTWIVSHFFEALSIQTGFPFGFYYYNQLAGPRLFQVPLIIMFAYFGTGYASWILAHVLLDQYHDKLKGAQVFWVPLIGAFIMTMWDLCMDPLCSTVDSLWVWRDPGVYFGVPLKNYFGWFFVVYIIFQLFAFYISKFDKLARKKLPIVSSKFFWIEAAAIYGIQGAGLLVQPFGATNYLQIYGSMALITIFTMMFVTLVSCLKIRKSNLVTF